MKRFILPVLLCAAFNAFSQSKKADLVITNVQIVDVANGKILPGKSVAISGEQIVAVFDDGKSVYKAGETVNGNGNFLMPGLWDMHMHFGGGDSTIQDNKNFLPLYLAHGITTVRDAAADISNSVVQWRSEINEGKLLGPTIFTSGPKLEGYKSLWKGDLEVGTVDEINKALDSLDRLKVDFVKITDNTMQPDMYLKSIELAHKRGYKVSGHIPSALDMKTVADAGLNSVEHLGYVYIAGSSKNVEFAALAKTGALKGRAMSDSVNATFTQESARKMYTYMAQKGMYVTPTLLISRTMSYLDENDHHDDPYLKYIGKGIRDTYQWRVDRAKQDQPDAIAYRHAQFERTASILPILVGSGVKILAGTDAGYLNSFVYPGIGLHQELELFVKYGMTPQQALAASVINSPNFLNLKNYGSVASGKMADLVLLRDNPLKKITATREIESVIVKGKLLRRKDLDQMLNTLAENNEK